jgi:hypothetical protein
LPKLKAEPMPTPVPAITATASAIIAIAVDHLQEKTEMKWRMEGKQIQKEEVKSLRY